ncbi:MAG: phytoene/squalene synthase family protein [Sphingobacteriales bacterium]|nr:phytoene/squalene synthase family protein [Sphingobacteriales bacterium]
MKEIYDKLSYQISKSITRAYSTSFTLGIRLLDPKLRGPIYAIYGFVRLADEIVDSFHDFNKVELLEKFTADTWEAIEKGISLNPVLNSFQQVVNEYQIDHQLISTFLRSMEMDLDKKQYNQKLYEQYILGSAEVVGLMCLKVFVYGDEKKYDELKYSAMKLGSAFQKINFLRDIQADYKNMGRSYFPDINYEYFNETAKSSIENDIEKDFRDGYEGIRKLPAKSRIGVYLAYVYYYQLFKKIKKTHARHIMEERIRINNARKYVILFSSYLRHTMNML